VKQSNLSVLVLPEIEKQQKVESRAVALMRPAPAETPVGLFRKHILARA
jgi:hypothetical protein